MSNSVFFRVVGHRYWSRLVFYPNEIIQKIYHVFEIVKVVGSNILFKKIKGDSIKDKSPVFVYC